MFARREKRRQYSHKECLEEKSDVAETGSRERINAFKRIRINPVSTGQMVLPVKKFAKKV
jgi:hypothetical protein